MGDRQVPADLPQVREPRVLVLWARGLHGRLSEGLERKPCIRPLELVRTQAHQARGPCRRDKGRVPVPDPRVGRLAKESLKVGKRALPAVRKRQEQKSGDRHEASHRAAAGSEA